MPVVDKFIPVRSEPTTVSRPWRVLTALWALGAFLALWASPDLAVYVAQNPDLPLQGPAVVATGAVETIADRIGLLGARRALTAAAAPLKDTTRVLKRPVVAPPAPPPEVASTDVAVDDRPGRRWASPASPEARRPKRILVVGASSIQYYLGTELERRLEEAYEDIEVFRKGKLGTGLTRDDFFDWPGEVAALMAEHRPDVVIAQFGGNDAQPILVSATRRRWAFGTEAWDTEYTARLEALTRQIGAAGALPIFLGMPVMRDAGFSGRIERLNRVTEAAVVAAGGRFVPTWDLAADETGAYRTEVTHGGRTGLLRMSDGIHYSRLGSQYMAANLGQRLEREFPLLPVGGTGSTVTRVALESKARQESTVYLAYVPRTLPDAGLPVLLLLHGAWGSYRDWPDHAHGALTALSTELGIIVVTPDGRPFGWYLDSPRVPDNQLETYFFDELIPDLRQRLPTDGRLSIAGLSMGGHGALTFAIRHPGTFSSVSSMSGVTDLTLANTRSQLVDLLGAYDEVPAEWLARSAHHLVAADPGTLDGIPLRLTCGDRDPWIGANRSFHALLEDRRIEHVFEESPGHGHTWTYWGEELPRHLRWHAAILHSPG